MHPLTDRDLQQFVDAQGLEAEIVRLEVETPTVESAAGAVGVGPDQIIKTLLFELKGQPVVVIACGTQPVRTALLAEHLGADPSDVTLASPKTVLAETGYQVGGVPPFGHARRLRTILDPGVLRQAWVYGGGGALDVLVHVKTADLLRVTQAEVLELRGTAPQA